MPQTVVLKHSDAGSFEVPLEPGQTAADVAAAWAGSGWSLADPSEPARPSPGALDAPSELPATEPVTTTTEEIQS